MASADQKAIAMLRAMVVELGGPVNWSEKEQWSRVAEELSKVEGRVVNGHATRLRYNNFMKKPLPAAGDQTKTKKKNTKTLEKGKAENKRRKLMVWCPFDVLPFVKQFI